jgi:hypothetical protein
MKSKIPIPTAIFVEVSCGTPRKTNITYTMITMSTIPTIKDKQPKPSNGVFGSFATRALFFKYITL